MTTNPDRLGSSPFAKSYATSGVLGADVDLGADGGGPCRRIYIGGTGNLVVKCARGGASVTYYALPVGKTIEIQATSLVASGSTATKITVEW